MISDLNLIFESERHHHICILENSTEIFVEQSLDIMGRKELSLKLVRFRIMVT